MDSRLQRVGGQRLAHLMYSDAPRVAQAITDAMMGRARVLSGMSHDTPYVEFVRPNAYTVVVRGDDWRVIFPFLRYGSGNFTPVVPPPNQPALIPSPQPNRLRQPSPVNPGPGLRSFLENFPFDQYSKIQKLLTVSNLTSDRPTPNYLASNPVQPPISLTPPEQRADGYDSLEPYNHLVGILQQLFPTDYPTSQV